MVGVMTPPERSCEADDDAAAAAAPGDAVHMFSAAANGNGRLPESVNPVAAATESCHMPGDTNECDDTPIVAAAATDGVLL